MGLSLRTQGFPVLAVTYNEGRFEMVEIGRTIKAPTTYTIPPNTAVIIRKYVSNKGYRTYYVYRVIDGELITILDEKNSFEIGEAPLTELERKAVEWFREMLFREMLEGQEVWVEKGVGEGGRL